MRGPPRVAPGVPAVEDYNAQIAGLEQELQKAVATQHFEKCGSIRDRIAQIKAAQAAAGGSGSGGGPSVIPAPVFDDALFQDLCNKLEHKIKEFVAMEAYEKCAPLRDSKKKLEDLKSKFDLSGPSHKAGVGDDLNAQMQKVLLQVS